MTALFGQDEFSLTDAEFRMFAELVRSHCGLHFSEKGVRAEQSIH